MKRTRHSAEQIIGKLRDASAMAVAGKTVGQIVQQLGVSEQTYYRWQQQYGNMQPDEAKRLRQLEAENQWLKGIIANQTIEISIHKEATAYLGKHRAPKSGGAS